MKRKLLFILSCLIGITAFAQQRNLNSVKQVFPRSIATGINDPQIQESLTESSYEMLSNKSGDLLKTNISSSANLFGIFLTDQRVVSAHPDLNMVVFGNRAGGSFGATGNDLRIAYSMDYGLTFTNFIVSPTEGSGFMFRYPSTIVYNPVGNTDPDNMFAIYSGPYTDAAGWVGQYFGSARIGGADVHTTFETNEPTVYINHMNNGLTVTPEGRVHVASQRLNGTSAAYTSAGWEVLNGIFNSETNMVDWDLPRVQVQPALLEEGRIDATRLVFSPDGSVGYLFGTAVDADLDYNPYGVEWPVVYKTTDHGLNWDKIEAFDFSQINTFYEYLWPTRADLEVVVPRWYNKWAAPENQSNNGATVDINGNLHIAGFVRSTYSIHPDSLNYTYSEEPYLIFDVFMNGDGSWNAQFVDTIRSEGLEDYLTVSLDQRVSMSRNADGSKVFVTWADTDPLLWGGGVTTNMQPDIFTWAYDVTNQNYTSPVNKTALTDYWGDNFWLHVSDYVLNEGSDYHIPLTTSINGATENDPVTHQYLRGISFNEADFINVGPGNNKPPEIVSVSQNYPNPFNNTTQIDINFTRPSTIGLEVYDLSGRLVYEIPASYAASGKHSLYLDAVKFKPGVYIYSVTTNELTSSRKMIVR